MSTETSWWDTLVAACISCSWLGVWPPTEWMVGNRPDAVIPEPRRGEGHLTGAFETTTKDEMRVGDRDRGRDDYRGAP